MTQIYRILAAVLFACLVGFTTASADPDAATLPSEMPKSFVPRVAGFDYVKRQVMIPMRDGVKLNTVILIPNGSHRAPMLLTRTPYGADERTSSVASSHLAAVLSDSDVADDLILHGGYIRVLQDVRGKYGSEGDYVMNRPLRGPLNPTEVDHATDTYDTIDWLVKNVPESNGRVGMYGISYDGFTTLMGMIHPHPALRAVVPINAMVDGWRGDDWFHNGAFRQAALEYAHNQEATRGSTLPWWNDHYDEYDSWLAAGSAGDMYRLHGLDQVGFARKLAEHPAYDDFWQGQAMDRILAREKSPVPVMIVHSLWDQEDIYGGIAVYKAIKPLDTDNSHVFLVLGPWFHHQERLDGSAIGAIRFGSDTAAYFRQHLLRPFLDHFLKDEAPPLGLPPVSAFETGTNEWRKLSAWPAGCENGCRIEPAKLYLQPGGKAGFAAAPAGDPGYEEYVSDPAKPVPFLPRPIHTYGDAGGETWHSWLVSDQREASGRTDVLSFATAPLAAPVKISGEPVADLLASTTGTDGDFAVKLIDVYPDEIGRQPALGGYQLAVSLDIFRGRYREGFSVAKPIAAGKSLRYRFSLPTTNHVFLPGHRIMVQVQSSLFPLYDRNPQKFVDNIFWAKSGDYVKALIRVQDTGSDGSFVELPEVKY